MINGGNEQTKSWSLPAGFGSFDASDWDPNGHLNVFPNMDVTLPRATLPGNLYHLAVHNEVKNPERSCASDCSTYCAQLV
jgi:hypothetical protein